MEKLNFRHRSPSREILDDADVEEKELASILAELDRINRLLGGYRISLDGLQKVIGSTCFEKPLKVLDVGCGNGSMLREVAKWARGKGIQTELVGIDSNEKAVKIAKDCSRNFPEISFQVLDVRSEGFRLLQADILLCTLTLHHFPDRVIKELVQRFTRISYMGIVINDLQRSPWAYYLFRIYCSLFMKNRVAMEDGLTSIQRSFKRKDLEEYGKPLKVSRQYLSWKWAFRYQWIIIK